MNHPTELIPLKNLHFDMENPRYGKLANTVKSEAEALDLIVSEFFVDDLLSSISVNGFFEGEPLIVKKNENDGFTVIEGNRRLATLLILANDERAVRQKRRHQIYRSKMDERGHVCPSDIPSVVVEDDDSANSVLAYLGTKHVVGPSPWDSFAKARWMAEMRAKTNMPLAQIKEMMGDKTGLVDRMLEGYYLVEQITALGLFDPQQSFVRGRGSNPEFPFSWIYTALNLGGVRKFLILGEKREPMPNPLSEESQANAGDFLTMIFGDRGRQREPVINESRDLAELAHALTNSVKSEMLREGKKLELVEELSKPVSLRLKILVSDIIDSLTTANGLLAGGITIEDARELDDNTLRLFEAARSLRRGVRQARDAGEMEDSDA